MVLNLNRFNDSAPCVAAQFLLAPRITGQEYCVLGSFYDNNKILFYGKMCYLSSIVYTTNTILNPSVLL